MAGTKYDNGKPRMSLVPQLAIREVAKVMTHGAEKYGTYNYLGGMDHTRLLDAALRHINSHLTGTDVDRESGLDHLIHAAASLLMVIELRELVIGKDGRAEAYNPMILERDELPIEEKKPKRAPIHNDPFGLVAEMRAEEEKKLREQSEEEEAIDTLLTYDAIKAQLDAWGAIR